MRIVYRYISFFAAVMCSGVLAAQNLDPTVEVSRAYEAKIAEAKKPLREMTVPDSVNTFRLDFDYSVFEKPYKGAYDFSPYLMSMRPTALAYNPRTLYLKAGAGYRLYPELDLIWSPMLKKGLFLDVYAVHDSYVGDYRTIGLSAVDGNIGNLDWDGSGRWDGYDLASKVGANLKYNWKAGVFGLNVDYYGLAGSDGAGKRGYDAVDLNFTIDSNKNPESEFVYNVAVDYRFGEDKMRYGQNSLLTEHLFAVEMSLGPVFKHGHKVVFDLGSDLSAYGTAVNGFMAGFHFTPHYVLKKGKWSVDAGLRIDVMTGTDNQQFIYPDVKVNFAAVKDALNVYASATGGTKMNTYSSIIDKNHYFNLISWSQGMDFLHADVERINAFVGLRGRISSKFSYDLSGGYACYANALLQTIGAVDSQLHPGIVHGAYDKAFAALDWRWDDESFKFDGSVVYTHTWRFERAERALAPAALTGNVALEYNWKRRIFVGVDCGFSTARKMVAGAASADIRIPGYADLGVSAQYAMNRKLSFWLRGGNLCCMTIQRTPLYAEGGISCTAGICLNL